MEVDVSNTCKSMAILVHGTWGVNATWVQEGSPFRKALQQACPDQIEFDVYTWPGKNSPSGRQSAAEGLSIKVEAAVLDRPNVPHFVVGHSHGGNIALRAVELTDAFASAHVVCLSTPFLCVEPRMYDEDLVESTTLSFALWTTAFLGLLWHFGSEGLPVRLRSEPMFIVVAAVFILPATYILGKFLPRWKASAINLAQSVTMKIPSSASVLVLRICGDEAAYAINMAQLLMLPLRYLSDKRKFLQAYADKVEIKFIKIPRRADFYTASFIAGAIVISTLAALAQTDVVRTGYESLGLLFFSAGTILFVITMIWHQINACAKFISLAGSAAVTLLSILVITPQAVLIALLTFLGILTIGREAWMLNLLYGSIAEPVPVGCWTLHQITPENPAKLNHSASYEDPAALHLICEWIANILNRDAESAEQ